MITPPGHEVLSLHHVHHHVDASRTSTVSLTRGSVREFLVDVGILYFCLFPASSRSKLFCSASSARFSAARIARSASSGRHTCRLPSWSHMAGFPVQRPRQKRQHHKQGWHHKQDKKRQHRMRAHQPNVPQRLAPQARQKRQHRIPAHQPKAPWRNGMGAPFLGAAPTAKTTASQARLAPQARQKRQHRMRAHQPKVPWRNRDGTALPTNAHKRKGLSFLAGS